MRRLVALLVLLMAAVPAASARATPPPVKHVFVVVLENQNGTKTFGPNSPSPYLAKTLRQRGQYLPNYFGVTHLSLGNYVALVSGQGSNPQTQADCQLYTDFAPGLIGADGQATPGQGCVYPSSVKTVADQLEARGLAWKGYMEDMGNDPAREPATCGHPPLNSQDRTQSAKKGDQYAARHNPFVYFHSIVDRPTCAANDVPLTRLGSDLAANRVGAYNFITPNLCHDGHDAPCVDGEPGGLKSADAFLKTWIPKITASPAYRDGGLIVVTFDESEQGAEACCNEPQFPNTPNNGGPTPGPGGGKVGTVLLSRFVQPGSVNPTPYNHFALLRSVEDIFGLSHLGYAARPELKAFGADVYNAKPCTETGDLGPIDRHGRFARGALILSARVSGRTLTVRMRHSARLGALLRGREVLGPRRVLACRTYRFTLPRIRGTLEIRARRSGVERRLIRLSGPPTAPRPRFAG